MTTMSTFIERMLLTVSTKVSPLLTEDCPDEKLITSAESRFLSQFKRKVLYGLNFQKTKLAIVISLREGTFFIGTIDHFLKMIGSFQK